MAEAINDQINAEYYSAFLYLSMATKFEDMDLPGFANWMRVQFQEEEYHAMRFLDHMVERGVRVKIKEIAAPPADWAGPLEIFEAAYEHELMVTGLINDLARIAVEDNDFASQQMLQWFIAEQVEEEDNTSSIASKIRMVQEAPGGIYLLDQELAQRVYAEPPPEGG
jgi:ferritin